MNPSPHALFSRISGARRALQAIEWAAPWLAPWRERGEAVAHSVCAGMAQPAALNQAGQAPVRFVPQSDLPAGMAYEQYIFDTGCVPTRDGLHDFFNGLVWYAFPLTKLRLNALQAAQIARTGIQPVRGPARDALTVFDENAALLQAPDAVWDALVAKDWQRLLLDLRPLWQQARLVLFGHALMEKLVFPRKSITAHVYRVLGAGDTTADMDAWLAQDLTADKLATKPFAHLPVLGVPGWWVANEDPAFYQDASVFRPSKTFEPRSL
ncbi:DUF3025 domain-containing protein [Rhodoferax sp.]|uniref:DUF3025 domain-containing protein n=1 Tax=Rhodoferax sp. TaxID=50421 RepID=UPI0008AAC34E|nr:DUF3025 domain-containing protein [Rhodoferax sp.]MDO8319787.1 DUF3025 domain-containing protein [Rhodoferax sp.]MDP2678969.1 DUF3025 domain-containing protein [Rhodoferax sp.]OGB55025.1 MAG: hypothetical protein A2503_16020 [Burkholderiales bacterium RIFOXYD12_FULL_59_19]OGB80898.1 MAG: hypothetical protein A2496_17730 [Burkholderiales bacterium RIFOXYC12_FULL_60_6]